MAQPPEGGLLRLPPKLRRKGPKPIPGNSEGSFIGSFCPGAGLPRFGTALPPRSSALPRCPVNCCASTHFEENQPALVQWHFTNHNSSADSSASSRFGPPLSFHPSFILVMDRSQDSIELLRLAARRLYCSPTTPVSRFRLLPFRSLTALRESLLLSFPLATKMFQLLGVVSYLPMDSAAVRKVALLKSRIYPYFQLLEAFRRLLRPSSSLDQTPNRKNWVYHKALYRLSSRVGDKRTRTADNRRVNHRLSVLVVPEDPTTGEPGTEGFPPFPPDSLIIRTLVLRMSHCPSPTLTAQPERTANAFHLLNGVLWSVRDPWMRERPWGDLVVPTGVEMIGVGPWIFLPFLLPHFAQGLKEIVHQAVRRTAVLF
ncbi:hypothetical protein HAX54_041395 [Datura stramonium]|uniref:Uncharacterized protein n=1 Tax=Datura stramonium TaxID=4076 RepID=A0ABS8SL60_DATST|nr:hypothetical protein [Datura stramonium]